MFVFFVTLFPRLFRRWFPKDDDDDVGKARHPKRMASRSTVSENARLDVNSSGVAGAGGSADDDFELWDQSGFMLRSDTDDPLANAKWGAQGWCRPSCIPITVILVLIVLVVLLPLLDHAADKYSSNSTLADRDATCMDDCKISFVETIPIGLTYKNSSLSHTSTYNSWMELIALAESKIEIGSFYWTLKREDVFPDDSAKNGEDVMRALMEAGRDRGIALKIAQNQPSQTNPNIDTEILAKKANAEVRSLNFAGLFGGGVLHTKLWLVDRKHLYVGSANMDWRSLSQVKELGLMALNCSCLANDLAKIFDVYWQVGADGRVPATWPESLNTNINIESPMNFSYMGDRYRTFIASSPPPFSPKGRTDDIDAILHCIEKAETFIYISVMDYFPLMIYTPKVEYWPVIDNALRAAAIERKVHLRLLISTWKHSRRSEDYFLKSLEDLTNSYSNVKVEVKRFIVPSDSHLDRIPFARVNHNKYMVTDVAAYVGTSNWSGDYFTNTAGIGLVFESVRPQSQESLRHQLVDIFLRDWNSQHARFMNESLQKSAPVIAPVSTFSLSYSRPRAKRSRT